MPITSPVERISGPSTESTMRPSLVLNRLNGSTASFTDDRRIHRHHRAVLLRQHAGLDQVADAGAHHDQRRGLRQRDAERLGHERHGARGARVGFEHVEHAGADGELHVEQTAHPDALRDRQGRCAHPVDHVAAQSHRRQRAGGVAGVDAGLLDVLHDAADVQFGAVVERVDVDFHGVVDEPVDQERRVRGDDRHAGDPIEVGRHRLAVVDDFHAAAAEHVGGAHQHRVADALGHGDRAWRRRSRCRCAVPAGPDASRMRENAPRSSARSIASGLVPRIGMPADLSPLASPSAVWPPSCTMTPTSSPLCALGVEHLEHVFEGQRLEVQPVGGVVVGGHRLRVAVDHDRLVAGRATARTRRARRSSRTRRPGRSGSGRSRG